MPHRLIPLALAIIVLSGAIVVAETPVTHPNLLLNRDVIKQSGSIPGLTIQAISRK